MHNSERDPTVLNPVSELYHYGIKNMKWGLQRFQLNGVWTPEGLARRREREGFGDGDRTGNGKYSKDEIVNSGSAKLVSKYRRELTTDELRMAVNRIDTEKKLDSLLKDADKSKWMKRAEASLKAAGALATTVDGVFTWATKGNGKTLMNMLSGKTARDEQITAKIKAGDYDWLKANFDSLSLSQQREATAAMGVRFQFETESWKKDNNEKKKKRTREPWEFDPEKNNAWVL